ncbi:hypothetical protein C2845_PM06G26580 [Panicum miliaceum]|uniref:Uncharacterized protein n=1 Tax=Panicum miliaceum TaxID=4540 RepID=A0A3L6R8W7_PANMI|nr:hypothetical protein C2845_PM06G26580 [Panicum miliaceum]
MWALVHPVCRSDQPSVHDSHHSTPPSHDGSASGLPRLLPGAPPLPSAVRRPRVLLSPAAGPWPPGLAGPPLSRRPLAPLASAGASRIPDARGAGARGLPAPSKKSKENRSKKLKPRADQALALDQVHAWAHPAPPLPEPSAADGDADDFLPAQAARSGGGDVLFELPSHSNHIDGFLFPSALVERAHHNGVVQVGAIVANFIRLHSQIQSVE